WHQLSSRVHGSSVCFTGLVVRPIPTIPDQPFAPRVIESESIAVQECERLSITCVGAVKREQPINAFTVRSRGVEGCRSANHRAFLVNNSRICSFGRGCVEGRLAACRDSNRLLTY